MKKQVLLTFLLIALSACSGQRLSLNGTESQSLQFDNDLSRLSLFNSGGSEIEVKVINPENQEVIRGFGLGPYANADVLVEAQNRLQIKGDGALRYRVEEADPSILNPSPGSVNFTLRNNSLKSIPLLIPSVMNPNLSPYSNSGVNLGYGQEIFFRFEGKKYLLLKVSSEIMPNTTIVVNELIEKRKAELHLN